MNRPAASLCSSLTILYDPYGGEIGRLEGPAEWHSEEAITLIEAALARF
ncbi:hypothetical protein [Woodsholea maritima]|nr:hypothetical protein [Woodsholea maritima]